MSYQEGCFDPCLCPIMMNRTLQGTFLVSPVVGSGTDAVFDITDVDWHFRQFDQEVQVAGAGTCTLGSISGAWNWTWPLATCRPGISTAVG